MHVLYRQQIMQLVQEARCSYWQCEAGAAALHVQQQQQQQQQQHTCTAWEAQVAGTSAVPGALGTASSPVSALVTSMVPLFGVLHLHILVMLCLR
jgi:hypothetical protein